LNFTFVGEGIRVPRQSVNSLGATVNFTQWRRNH